MQAHRDTWSVDMQAHPDMCSVDMQTHPARGFLQDKIQPGVENEGGWARDPGTQGRLSLRYHVPASNPKEVENSTSKSGISGY